MTRRYKKHDGQFKGGRKHPRFRTDEEILDLLRGIDMGTLRSNEKIVMEGRSRRYAEYVCIARKCKRKILVDNILNGKSMNCSCQRRRKYPNDGRAKLLGRRYDAIIQRCYRDTHLSSHNYKGRGIKCEFESREDFIFWALDTFPDTDFVGFDFDRIDNDGNYSKENLELVLRRANTLNTRRSKRNKKKKT